MQVIALDSPFEGADALFATDNYKAGILIGQYAKAALGGKPARSPCWTCSPATRSVPSATNGFMNGFGLKGQRRQVQRTVVHA